MKDRWTRIGRLAGVVILLVVIFQLVWPYQYSSLVALNPDPTAEYLRIMWLLSPNGLSVITIMVGCILIAWIAYVSR